MRTTIAIFLFLFAVCSPPGWALRIRISPNITFISETGRPTDFQDMRKFLKAMDRTVAVTANLFDGKETYHCYIRLRKKPSVDLTSNKTVSLRLPPDFTDMSDRSLQLRLLNILLLSRLGISPEKNYKKMPLWLTAGMWHRFRRYSRKAVLTGPLTYPTMHYLATNGQVPLVRDIIQHPIYPQDGPAFEFYAEACELLMNSLGSLKGGSREAFNTLLSLSLKNPKEKQQNFTEAFNPLFTKWVKAYYASDQKEELSLNLPDPCDKWFENMFMKKSINIFNPGTATFGKQSLKRIFGSIKYYTSPPAKKGQQVKTPTATKQDEAAKELAPEESNLIQKKMSASSLLATWPSVVNKEDVAHQLRGKLFMLKYQLPEPFYESLDMFIEAVDELADDDPEEFMDEYKAALAAFEKSCAYWEKVQAYLLETENKYISPFYRYHYAVEGYERKKETKENSRKSELDTYLDRIEQTYSQ